MDPIFIAIDDNPAEAITRRVSAAARNTWSRLNPDIPAVRAKELTMSLPDCAGAIVMVPDPAYAERLRRLDIPVVNFSNRLPPVPRLATVVIDDREVGAVAGRHVLDQGFRRAKYFGIRGFHFSEERYAGFEQVLQQAGVEVERHLVEPMDDPNPLTNHEMRVSKLREALDPGEIPYAVFCQNDALAREFSGWIQEAGLHASGPIALIGVDNLEADHPYEGIPLTSVEPDFTALGKRAAETLDRCIRNPEAGIPPPVRVSGARLWVRASSQLTLGRDPRLEPVLQAIRTGVSKGAAPRVGELAERFGVSDRTLLHWFRDAGLQAPRQHILELRLERARDRIRATDRPISEIAAACGFRKQGALSEHFKRRYGLSPRAFRKQSGAST